jgi:hypothetical protein
MSANHVAYETSVKAAGAAATISKASNEINRQGVIAAGGSSIGFRPGFPANYATYATAVAAAAAQKPIDDAAAEQNKQAAIQSAKDLLRSQGELP